MSRVTVVVIIALSLLSVLSAFQLGYNTALIHVAKNPGKFVKCGNCNSAYNREQRQVLMFCNEGGRK